MAYEDDLQGLFETLLKGVPGYKEISADQLVALRSFIERRLGDHAGHLSVVILPGRVICQFSSVSPAQLHIRGDDTTWVDDLDDTRVVRPAQRRTTASAVILGDIRRHRWFLSVLGLLFLLFLVVANSAQAIREVSATLVTFLSIFLPIFVLFTTASDPRIMNSLSLFESGKLYYYADIDKAIVKLSLACIVGLLGVSTATYVSAHWKSCFGVYQLDWWLILLATTLALLLSGVVLMLMALYEYYIPRSTEYAMGQLKDQWFSARHELLRWRLESRQKGED